MVSYIRSREPQVILAAEEAASGKLADVRLINESPHDFRTTLEKVRARLEDVRSAQAP